MDPVFKVSQNYPNPFNPLTNIDLELTEESNVLIELYDMKGIKVSTILNEAMNAGYYTIPFNASNLASGMYFYKITAGLSRNAEDFVSLKKMLLIK